MQKRDKDLPERTYQYGRRIIALFEALPETKLAQTLGLQLQGARRIILMVAPYRRFQAGCAGQTCCASRRNRRADPDFRLLRAGTSVSANYREADRGRSKAEFIAKMGDSPIIKNAKGE